MIARIEMTEAPLLFEPEQGLTAVDMVRAIRLHVEPNGLVFGSPLAL